MSPSKKLLLTSGYVVVLLVLGGTDALLTQNINKIPAIADGGSSSEPDDEGPGVRTDSPDIFEVFNAQNIVTESTREQSLLEQIVPSGTHVEARVLLKDDDRLSFFAWVESDDVQIYNTALKEALHTSFSSEVTDLVDEEQDRSGKPIRDVLSFYDPAIHEERLLFIRVRDRLFEFHIPSGKEPDIQVLMDALTE